MVIIIWTDTAIEDLNSIHQYIGKDSAFDASRLIDRILKRVEQLENHPKLGMAVPEFEIETLRELIEGNYRIITKLMRIILALLGCITQKCH